MRIAIERPDLLVVDELLPADVFAALAHEVAAADYRSVHSKGWDRAWLHSDGTPWRGAPVYYDPARVTRHDGARYPTGTSVDACFDAICGLARARPDLVGVEQRDWAAMFLAPWLYPPGSALSMHRDGGAYSGAFTYFVHPNWELEWGGELMVFDRDQPSWPDAHRSSWLFPDERGDRGSGIATAVQPRPNRVALLGPGRPHLIRRVDTNAGGHVRVSLAGFFLRPQR